MPRFHGGFHGGHGGWHGGHGVRFYGGGYGGYPAYYEPIVPFVPIVIEAPPSDVDNDDTGGDGAGTSVTSVSGIGTGYRRGTRFFKAPDRLTDVAKVMIPAPTSVQLATELRGTSLAITACIDGKCYRGVADLSGILAEIEPRIIERAQALHNQWHQEATTHTLVGAEALVGEVQERVSMAGELLVGAMLTQHHAAICAGWWHDLTSKVKSVVSSAAHEVTHPSELVHDVSHYALHPSEAVRKAAQGLGAGAGFANVLSYITNPLQDVAEDATVQQMTAMALGGPQAAAAVNAAQALGAGQSIQQTLKQAAPQIASAASSAAGAAGGPAAAGLAGALVNAAAGTGSTAQVAQQAVNAVKAAAASDPTAKAILDVAHPAVAQATAAQHVASTIQSAASGNQAAKDQVLELTTAAAGGDPSAQGVVSAAQNMASQAQSALGDLEAAVSGETPAHTARALAAETPGRVIGVVQHSEGNWSAKTFATPDDADDWFGQWLGLPHAFRYVAYFDKSDSLWPAPLNDQIGKPHTQTAVSGWPAMLLSGGLGFAAGRWGGDVIERARAAWASRAAHTKS